MYKATTILLLLFFTSACAHKNVKVENKKDVIFSYKYFCKKTGNTNIEKLTSHKVLNVNQLLDLRQTVENNLGYRPGDCTPKKTAS